MRAGRATRRAGCRGTAALEFAIVSGAFLPLAFGILVVGLTLWTRNTLQTAADLTARCVAIGSPDCPDPAQFAASVAQSWTVISTAPTVSVTTAGACNGAPGSFTSVTITSAYWAGLSALLPAASISATACYPLASS